MVRSRFVGLSLVLVLLLAAVGEPQAACNLIPSARQTFRSSLGATNRPYAAPGDYVEIGVRPGGCDAASAGFGPAAGDHVVTVVFTPPANGPRRVAFLTADDCNSAASLAKLAACEGTVGAGRVTCFGGGAANLALVSRDGIPHLSFRFPDTDALAAPDNDQRTLSGPATLAVTAAGAPLPCGLATQACASQGGTIACIDDLYAADGSCQPNLEPTFPHFTALPIPNDYRGDCFDDAPPCTALQTEVRSTVDTFGNLLMPINWEGVLVNDGGTPVPRLLHAAVRSPLPVPTPPAVNLGSFTPEGAVLPPIFEPNVEPGASDPNVLRMFGSADAGYTILRLARRAGTCACGDAVGTACVLNSDCADAQSACAPGQTRCATSCVGGTSAGAPCTTDAECPGAGARCGLLFGDFRPLAKPGGPITLTRTPLPNVDGICQLQPNLTCDSAADCTGVGDPCVSYAFEANTPVPLESLTTTSEGAYGFSVTEAVANEDVNGDGDLADTVVTLRDRQTGNTQPLGGQSGCNLAPAPGGRAVVRSRRPPFTFPAVEAEGDVIAFLESETETTLAQTPAAVDAGCDENADGDDRDTILRAFRLGPTELATTMPQDADGGLAINGRALALSDGRLFFRAREASHAAEDSVRVGTRSPNRIEVQSGQFVQSSLGLSGDGRYVAFASLDTLVAEDLGTNADVYVRDVATGALELISARPDGFSGDASSALPDISRDGRWVVFTTLATDIVSGLTTPGVVLHDRCISNGVGIAGCTPSSQAASVSHNGMQPTGAGLFEKASVSDDGRYVAFVDQRADVVADANFGADAYVRDRCSSNGVAVAGCTPTTERVSVASDGSAVQQAVLLLPAAHVAMSGDGRFIVFPSNSSGVVNPSPATNIKAFVRDRFAGTTTLASIRPDGLPFEAGLKPSISGDGRYVTFLFAAGAVPTIDTAVVIRDRLAQVTDLIAPPGFNELLGAPAISDDGRFVTFASFDSALVPADTNSWDVFVRDRATGITRRVNVAPDGGETSMGGTAACGCTDPACASLCGPAMALAADGTTVAYSTNAAGIVTGDADTEFDAFVRRLDPASEGAADLSGDGDANDTVLRTIDTAAPAPAISTLCPASVVAAAGGMTAFLRPEASGEANGCPAGTPIGDRTRLNADTDTTDAVVHLWRGGVSAIANLRCAARDLAMSATVVGALVDEAGEGADLNGDLDVNDAVARAYRLADTAPASCASWQTSTRAAEGLKVCGDHVAFLVPECDQGGTETDGCPAGGTDLNGDGDAADRVLHVWTPPAAPVNTQRAAEDFVCTDALVAFRTRESAQCPGGAGCSSGLNGPFDTDLTDDVLAIWDLTAGALISPGRAVRACDFAACDPRFPYRVLSTKTRFLTTECHQAGTNTTGCPAGGLDINGDGDAADIVLQNYDTDTAELTVLGAFDPDTPDAEDPTDPVASDDEVVFESTGRCVETVGGGCVDDAGCGTGEFCGTGTCRRAQGVCETSADCPPSIPCDTSVAAPIVPASPDTDDDGVPDHLDNCPATANVGQEDLDADRVGDACDLAICGNDTVEYDEQCDGTQAGQCSGGCLASCRCAACGVAITDPRAAVVVRTPNQAGQLRLKAQLPLAGYTGAPVSIRLDDTDSAPLALQSVGALPPKGTSGRKWMFKTTALGVQKVMLRRAASGAFTLTAKSKGWFPTAAANQPAANTSVTVTVGTQCFTRAATVKVD